MRVFLTGATGYVGGRLARRLFDEGHDIVALVRDPRRLPRRDWTASAEIVEGDLGEPDTYKCALGRCDAAYYLVHSMGGDQSFRERDRTLAATFAAAAKKVSIPHVIYLGGLEPSGQISGHLASRLEVGEEIRSATPTTEFRAGPVIGSGSLSFEMVRYLTERLPAMIAPKWILNDIQPIAIRDVLAYLTAALDVEPQGVVDIGADVLTFREMMLAYARKRGLKRRIWPVPVLAPKLAGLWVGLVTPLSNRIAVPLVEGVIAPVTGDTAKAEKVFPSIDPMPYDESVELALQRVEERMVETRWSTSRLSDQAVELKDEEGLLRERRVQPCSCSAADLYRTFLQIGGAKGYFGYDWAWAIRGFFDQLIGGPGLRRGRRHPREIYTGEAIDFWRVEEASPPERLRLRAEMKVPGQAWLQFETQEEGGQVQLVQTAFFRPRGLAGFLYWWAMYPMHGLIFGRMARAIVRESEQAPDPC